VKPDEITEIKYIDNYSDGYWTKHDYSLYYQHKFNNPEHEFSTELYYKRVKTLNDQIDKEYNVLPGGMSLFDTRTQYTDNIRDWYRIQADYNQPIGKSMKFSSGLLALNLLTDNKYKNIKAGPFDVSNYDEFRLGTYANLAYKIDRTNLQTGLRYEISDIYIKKEPGDTSNKYGELLPFLSVQTKLGKRHTLRLNYRKSIVRPRLFQVNPFTRQDDTYTLSSGNPDLGPGKTHKFEFTHRINILSPIYVSYRPYFSLNRDLIQMVTNAINDTVSFRKYENVSQSREYGCRMSGNLAFAKWWTVSPNFTYYHKNILSAQDKGIDGLSKNSWRMNVSSRFIFSENFICFVDFNKQSKSYSHQTTRENQYMTVLGFWKKFNDHLNVVAFILNPWESKYYFRKEQLSSTNMYKTSTGFVDYDFVANFRISYSFNKGKEIKKLRNKVEGEQNTGIGGGISR
jgi:outer membrane receptor protein involved in Fe transport